MAAKGESRTGLVVFLVLFILLSITLGVTTYYGYQEADVQKKAAKDSDGKAKSWESDANWYRYVANTYRAYIGYPPPAQEDVQALRTQYGSGGGAQDKAKADDHKKIIDGLDANKKWDVTTKKPADTYQDEIDSLKKKLNAALADAEKEKGHAAEMEALAATRENERKAFEAEHKAKFLELKNSDQAEADALRKKVTDLQAQLDAQGEANKKGLEPLLKENADLRTANKKLTGDLGSALKTITERGYEAEAKLSREEIDVTKINPANLATVVKITGNGDTLTISLGSADNLKPQVTFSVYGKGADGRPLRDRKGALEVVRVIGEHLAQARLTDLRDERRDPVLPGDYIFSPTWNPNLKQHVAIVGTIDLTGEGRDSTQEFIRTLKRQNVEVDAWMDMKTSKMTGEITRQTDLLIVGGYPDLGTGVVKEDPKKNAAIEAMTKVQDQASRLGVRIVRLNAFLEMAGYALPKPLRSEKPKIDFQKTLPAAGSPIERKEPAKPADQPK
jgi:hypothetical protein